MARRSHEINIFNIAFLDVITGAMGAFVLMVLLLAPYYTGASVNTQEKQKAAQDAVDRAKKDLQAAGQSGDAGAMKQAMAKVQADLDETRNRLDGLRQQIDQLSAQNKRLTKLDDQQQQQIAQLQQQAAQSAKDALDRAEQNMRQADQAAQTGDIEALKRLLAQARADLALARRQLGALQQQLAQTQAALRHAEDENAALKQQLAEAEERSQVLQRERDGAIQKYTEAEAAAMAGKATLATAAPTANQAMLLELTASPECGETHFSARDFALFSDLAAYKGFGADNERLAYGLRAVQITHFQLPGPTDSTNAEQAFHGLFVVQIPDEVKLFLGFSADKAPPANCHVSSRVSYTTHDTEEVRFHWYSRSSAVAMSNTNTVLFVVLPPSKDGPYNLIADDLAAWKKNVKDGVAPTDWTSAQPSVQQQPPVKFPFGPPAQSGNAARQEKH